MENKQKILDLLLPALQETRNLDDLKELKLIKEEEFVVAKFQNGGKKRVNVSCDSGTTMIKDILNEIL